MPPSSQRGVAPVALVIVAAMVLIGGSVAYYLSSRTGSQAKLQTQEKKTTGQKNTPPASASADDKAKEKEKTTAERNNRAAAGSYAGTALAGTAAPLLDFTNADFATAAQSDKLVVLYFYANWCPICREEFPQAQAAFDELATDQVIGFRVNYRDDQTDADEAALARQHGVAYQHTKVFIKGGQQLLKSPESWPKDRYLAEITSALAQ